MAKRIEERTPKEDGFYMPAESAPQEKVWMIWPESCDNWRQGAKPAQEAFLQTWQKPSVNLRRLLCLPPTSNIRIAEHICRKI